MSSVGTGKIEFWNRLQIFCLSYVMCLIGVITVVTDLSKEGSDSEKI